ncbi:UTP--glucose-1-phosphate uridylyltransferase [Candidatus Dojkabacteria bacterium]|nr:UTP--glucose-1-phosphate uridylyltransferase [Candidatus Dojkabacteria bacterium]
MVRKAVITDAGFASRYLPITKTIPKGMLPMHNKPIMQLVVEECVEAGIEEIVIVATPEGKPIYDDYFNNAVNRIRKQLAAQGKAERYKPVQEVLDFPKINVITQDQSLPYGNGSPLLSAREFLNGEEAFLYMYSDDIVLGRNGAVKALVEEYNKDRSIDGLIAVQKVSRDEIVKYASVRFKTESEEFLDELIEKPDAEKAPSLLASYGRYLLTPKVFDYLVSEYTGKDGELWTADAIDKLAKIGRVKVVKVDSKWMTTGDPENYIKAYIEYLKFIGK